MKKNILIFLILLFTQCAPDIDLTKYENLKEPKFSEKNSFTTITIQLEGTAGEIAKKGMGDLFKVSYELDSKYRIQAEAPRGRWKFLDEKDISKADQNSKMIGKFALVVSQELKDLPDSIKKKNPQIQLEKWEYGKVAEILHIGSYDKETPTIKRLLDFIDKNGFKVSGLHEEEYLKGPGWLFKGNPDNYYTIIRYQVEKK